MIQFFHVYKTYGTPKRTVLSDINIEIAKGEIAYLYGPTGAGKSTILKLLFGLEQADDGQILVLGRNVSKLKKSAQPYFRRNIGFVFQDFKLFSWRTVYENVALVLKVAGVSPTEIRRKTREALRAVGLEGKRLQLPSMLSAGEQQRVCVARAIVNRPVILLADEPAGNLDSKQADEIYALLKEINQVGTTVLGATHNSQAIGRIRPRVISIHSGKIIEDGSLT